MESRGNAEMSNRKKRRKKISWNGEVDIFVSIQNTMTVLGGCARKPEYIFSSVVKGSDSTVTTKNTLTQPMRGTDFCGLRCYTRVP